MTSITPCLWFQDDLGEAVDFYTKIFPNSSVDVLQDHDDARPGATGGFTVADFTLDGLRFRAIGQPSDFKFTEAVSFSIACRDQTEVDYYWDNLVAGGEESVCGWLKDKYGVSWQVVPAQLQALLSDPVPARAQAAMQAMLGMRRLVVADLLAAADAAAPPRA